MKFSGAAAITALLSLATAFPIVQRAGNSTVLKFELAGITGPKPDIHKEIPLQITDSDQLAIPDSKTGSSAAIYATIKPWAEGELLGLTADGASNGLQGYLIKSSKDKIYDFKFGKLPSDKSKVITKGFFPAEDHPAHGAVGIQQLFFAEGNVVEGAFVYESSSAQPHPLLWYASDDTIPEGYTQVWITRPIHAV